MSPTTLLPAAPKMPADAPAERATLACLGAEAARRRLLQSFSCSNPRES